MKVKVLQEVVNKRYHVDIIKEGVLTMKNNKIEDNNSNFILEHHVY